MSGGNIGKPRYLQINSSLQKLDFTALRNEGARRPTTEIPVRILPIQSAFVYSDVDFADLFLRANQIAE